MSGATVSAWDAVLKENYSTERLVDKLTAASPFFASLRKATDFVGRRKVVPWKYGTNAAVSTTVAHAQAMLGSELAVDALITRAKLIGIVRLEQELLHVAEKDRGAFQDAADAELQGTEDWLVHMMATAVFRNGSGSIGRIASASTAATTITLTNAGDAMNFIPGIKVGVSVADGTGSLRGSPSYVTITAVDPIAGTVTASDNWSTISGCVQYDYIFIEGMHAAAIMGLDGYCPSTVTATSFYGVTRTLNPYYLAGFRWKADGGSLEESITRFLVRASRVGANYDQMVMNNVVGGTLVTELGSKAVYDRTKSSSGDMGVDKLTFRVPTLKGKIDVILDPHCQESIAWGVELSKLKFESAGPAPHIQQDKRSGYIAFPVADDDAVEMRMAMYGNLIVYNPTGIGRLDSVNV